jgi:dihydrofolate reductase
MAEKQIIMKIVMAMVSTVNGKITRGEESSIYQWTSKEDQNHFFTLLRQYSLIVMGSNTFEAARTIMRLEAGTLRVVLTTNPQKYEKEIVMGQLEFTDESPHALVKRLKKAGYTDLLLVGGATINSLFLQSELVDEVYLTIEPKLFGQGKDLLHSVPLDVQLQLLSTDTLNERGTLLLKYRVVKKSEKANTP